MGFLFLTSAEKENGFSFSEQVPKKMDPLLDVYKQIVQPYTPFEFRAENIIENESVEKESIRIRHLVFLSEKQQTSLHLLHMCV